MARRTLHIADFNIDNLTRPIALSITGLPCGAFFDNQAIQSRRRKNRSPTRESGPLIRLPTPQMPARCCTSGGFSCNRRGRGVARRAADSPKPRIIPASPHAIKRQQHLPDERIAQAFDVLPEAVRTGSASGERTVVQACGDLSARFTAEKTADVPLIESRVGLAEPPIGSDRQPALGRQRLDRRTDQPAGQHRRDGWHVYPKQDGLLNSLRLE